MSRGIGRVEGGGGEGGWKWGKKQRKCRLNVTFYLRILKAWKLSRKRRSLFLIPSGFSLLFFFILYFPVFGPLEAKILSIVSSPFVLFAVFHRKKTHLKPRNYNLRSGGFLFPSNERIWRRENGRHVMAHCNYRGAFVPSHVTRVTVYVVSWWMLIDMWQITWFFWCLQLLRMVEYKYSIGIVYSGTIVIDTHGEKYYRIIFFLAKILS